LKRKLILITLIFTPYFSRGQIRVQITNSDKIETLTEESTQSVLYEELSARSEKLNLGLLKLCIRLGADPNTVGSTGWTCLHECAMQNDTDFALILLDKDHVAPDSATIKNNATPYIIAASRHHKAMYDLLISRMDPKKFANRTFYSDSRAIDFLGPKEQLRVFQEEQNRISIWNLLHGINSASCDQIEDSIKKYIENRKLDDNRLRYILSDNAREFRKMYQYAPQNILSYTIKINDFPVIEVKVDEYILAALYGSKNILKVIIDHHHELNPNTMLSPPTISDCFIAKDSSTKEFIKKNLYNYNIDIMPLPIITWIEPNQNNPTINSNQIHINVCLRNIIQTDSVKLLVNSQPPMPINEDLIINEKPQRQIEKVLDKKKCPIQISMDIPLHEGTNHVSIEAGQGRRRIHSELRIEYSPNNTALPKPTGKRKALVIGNSVYTSYKTLQNPYHDADSVTTALNSICFDVTEAYDVCKSDILSLIDRFNNTLNDSDVTIVYYSGHGEDNNGFYMIPADAKILNDSDDIDSNFCSIAYLKYLIKKTSVIVFIMDACRVGNQNPSFAMNFPRSGESKFEIHNSNCSPNMTIQRALDDSNKSVEGYVIAYSTVEGYTASDGSGNSQNSPYTWALLQHIRTLAIPISDIFNMVGKSLKTKNEEQIPNYTPFGSSGSFYLNPFQK
jgi:ankyrin repeat protein